MNPAALCNPPPAGSADQTIRLWDYNTGALLEQANEHSGVLKQLAFSPDGNQLVSGAADGTFILWKL